MGRGRIRWYNRPAPQWLVDATRQGYRKLGGLAGIPEKTVDRAFDKAIQVGNQLIPVRTMPSGSRGTKRSVPSSGRSVQMAPSGRKLIKRTVRVGPSKKKASYVTRGYVGKFTKRKRVGKTTKHLKMGSLKMRDAGGAFTSEDGGAVDRKVLYVGHSCMNRDQIIQALGRAVLRALLKQAGIDLVSWEDNLRTGNTLYCEVFSFDGVQDTSEGGSGTGTFFSGNKYAEFAAALSTAIVARVGAAQQTVEYTRVVLWNDAPGLSDNIAMAQINLKNARLDMYFASKLSLQNRTVSSAGGSTDAHSIENNPLQGYRYKFNGNVPVQRATMSTRTANELAPLGNTGLVSYVPSDPEDLRLWQRPVKPQFFTNVKYASRVMINPGQIKSSFVSYQRSMSFSSFINMFKDNLFQAKLPSTDAVKTSIGASEVIGLEKMLDSRTTGEPVISIGYEHHETYAMSLYYKRTQPCVAIKEVVN